MHGDDDETGIHPAVTQDHCAKRPNHLAAQGDDGRRNYIMKHLHNFYPLPEVEEVEINLPADYREQVRAAYAREAEVAIGMIEAQVQQLLADNAPAQWAVDDAPEPDYEDWNDYEEAA